jgi:nucleotide-binding universal stress UspA family protein
MAAMYRRILVAIENSPADQAILTHIGELAKLTGSTLVLVHVADGWAARHFDELQLRESEEMKADRAYLDQLKAQLAKHGLRVETHLATGDPATELAHAADTCAVDLVAMATHGHRFIADVLHGATADRLRHLLKVPVLMVRAQPPVDQPPA